MDAFKLIIKFYLHNKKRIGPMLLFTIGNQSRSLMGQVSNTIPTSKPNTNPLIPMRLLWRVGVFLAADIIFKNFKTGRSAFIIKLM